MAHLGIHGDATGWRHAADHKSLTLLGEVITLESPAKQREDSGCRAPI
jgi:hypothetical protein